MNGIPCITSSYERIAEWSREYTLQFIKMYEGLPCLWKVNSPDYHNRLKKERAYRELLVQARVIYPATSLDIVKKKINNLRTGFRKEHKRVLAALKSGVSDDDLYSPRLWYYSQLLFTADHEGEAACESQTSVDEISSDLQVDENSADESPASSSAPALVSSIRKRSLPTTDEASPPFELVELAAKKHIKDECPKTEPNNVPLTADTAFGSNVVMTISDITDRTQRILCERLITDVIAQARLGMLDVTTTIGRRENIMANYDGGSDYFSRGQNSGQGLTEPPIQIHPGGFSDSLQ